MASEQQSSTSTRRMVKIKSYDGIVVEVPDGIVVEVPEAVAVQSTVIKNVVEDVGVELPIPIPTPNVTGDILTKVFEFCTKHAEFAAAKEEMDRWDRQFINVPANILYDVTTAADYLDIGELMNLCWDKMKSMIADKSSEEFNIQNDFTPEELKALQKTLGFDDDDEESYNNYIF